MVVLEEVEQLEVDPAVVEEASAEEVEWAAAEVVVEVVAGTEEALAKTVAVIGLTKTKAPTTTGMTKAAVLILKVRHLAMVRVKPSSGIVARVRHSPSSGLVLSRLLSSGIVVKVNHSSGLVLKVPRVSSNGVVKAMFRQQSIILGTAMDSRQITLHSNTALEIIRSNPRAQVGVLVVLLLTNNSDLLPVFWLPNC